MNVTISMDAAEVQEATNIKLREAVNKLKIELDDAFRNKITTPEQVISTADMLKRYYLLSGENYEITFEENTIV